MSISTLADHQKASATVKGHHGWKLVDGKHQYVPVSWSKEENEFPKWRYHAIKDPKLIQNKAEEDRLTPSVDGWQNLPVTASDDDWQGQLTRQTAQIVTPAHVEFCQAEGYGIQNVPELQTLLNDPQKVTTKARQAFFAAADKWIKANKGGKQQKAS